MEILKQLREAVHRKRRELWLRLAFLTTTVFHFIGYTLSSSFGPKNWFLKWNIHPVPLIWLWMTSGCF